MVDFGYIEKDFEHSMPSFKSFFKKVVKVYKRNSGFRGTIPVEIGDFSEDESDFFNQFMNKRPNSRKNTYKGIGVLVAKKVPLAELQKAFESMYGEVNFLSFLEYVNGGKIIVKKEKDSKERKRREKVSGKIEEINEKFIPLFLNSALKDESIIEDLKDLDKVMNNLPSKATNISFFANDLFSDPHALDSGKRLTRLLEAYMFSIYEKEDGLSDTENLRNAYQHFNLVKDDISSIVYSYNITNNTPPWDYLNEKRKIKASTLNELSDLDILYPAKGNSVIIIENNNVFSNLTRDFPELSFICGSGQFTSAVWKMLRLLDKNAKIYYSGDIDKNGIMIADQLEEKLGVNIHYLAMSEDIYSYSKKHNYSSTNQATVNVKSESLKRQADLINLNNAHVYQESFYGRLVEEIKKEVV